MANNKIYLLFIYQNLIVALKIESIDHTSTLSIQRSYLIECRNSSIKCHKLQILIIISIKITNTNFQGLFKGNSFLLHIRILQKKKLNFPGVPFNFIPLLQLSLPSFMNEINQAEIYKCFGIMMQTDYQVRRVYIQ